MFGCSGWRSGRVAADRIEQDLGEEVVAALRDRYLDRDVARPVALRGSPDSGGDAGGPLEGHLEQTGLDEPVEMKRGQLARDPDRGRDVFASGRLARVSYGAVHARALRLIERFESLDSLKPLMSAVA